MESTMREFLKKRFPNGKEGLDHEEVYWAIKEQLANMDMCWTTDDRNAVTEFGEDPDLYMTFSEDQISRIDDISAAAVEFCRQLVSWPNASAFDEEYERKLQELYNAQIWCVVAEHVADILDRNGFRVHFPTHVEDENVEYITDLWNE